MKYPGMGDPYKRNKTLKFLAITAIIAILVGVTSSVLQGQFSQNDPLKVCINDRETPYKMKVTLELIIDGLQTPIPANINAGLNEGECKRTMYTLTDDGIIYVEWEEEYSWEIGHFLWMWDFPLRDMDQDKSTFYVNDKESSQFINTPLQDGYHYKGVFTTKDYDSSKDKDFLPELEN
ncbi:MAG: hypothetical protein OEW78_06090 [Nitrosopumilus sp.]|uniref:hypothetical protein n=1 Tax=Nitrosopumilus sp. TaxID=2024843 RepID=UPI002472CCB1|nr:hypothetical protein [Nitrosopumilus sp.]MDH5431437.1 hypothetical protein [Nitrosopumilus sp.]